MVIESQLGVIARAMSDEDRDEVARMRRSLGAVDPFLRLDETGSTCFVIERDGAGLCGLAEVSLRPFAEGSWEYAGDGEQASAYVEGLWVDEDARRAGAGRRLWAACEAWARAQGSLVLAASVRHDDPLARAFIRALGCRQVAELIHHAKAIGEGEDGRVDDAPRVRRADLVNETRDLARMRKVVFPARPLAWHRAHVERARARTSAPIGTLGSRGFFVAEQNIHYNLGQGGYAEVVLRSPELAEVEWLRAAGTYTAPGSDRELLRACERWALRQGASVLTTTTSAYQRPPSPVYEQAGFAIVGWRAHYVKRVVERPRSSAPPREQVELFAAIYDSGSSAEQKLAAQRRFASWLVEHGHPLGEVLQLRERLQALPKREPDRPGLLARWRARFGRYQPTLRDELEEQHSAAFRRYLEVEARCVLDADGAPPRELPDLKYYEPPIGPSLPIALIEDLAQCWMLAGLRTLKFRRPYCDERCQLLLRSPYLARVERVIFYEARVSADTLAQVVDAQAFPALRELFVYGSGGSDWGPSNARWDCPDYVTSSIGVAQLERLLAMPGLARLRTLSLELNDFPIEAAELILACPYLDQLERFAVVPGNFGALLEDPVRDRAVARIARRFGERLDGFQDPYVQRCLAAH
jgi:GNAT superfamily N-acetyltransferase